MNFFFDNPDMLGIAAAFLTQVGARHLSFNFSTIQRKLIAHPISQAIIMFGMFYLSTRKLVFALSLLVLYYLLIHILLNETHPLNVIPRKWLISEGFIDAKEKSAVDMYFEGIEHFRNQL